MNAKNIASKKIGAVLLAAGEGRRMNGQVKQLLKFRGRSFVCHAVGELFASQISELIVVTGSAHSLVEEELLRHEWDAGGRRFELCYNADFRRGMLASIQVGVRALSPEIDAFLVCLVDQPFINRAHYNRLIEAYCSGDAGLMRPSFAGKAGNPALIAARYIPRIILADPRDRGCSFLFEEFRHDSALLEMGDGASLIDIDSPRDYSKHIRSLETGF